MMTFCARKFDEVLVERLCRDQRRHSKGRSRQSRSCSEACLVPALPGCAIAWCETEQRSLDCVVVALASTQRISSGTFLSMHCCVISMSAWSKSRCSGSIALRCTTTCSSARRSCGALAAIGLESSPSSTGRYVPKSQRPSCNGNISRPLSSQCRTVTPVAR